MSSKKQAEIQAVVAKNRPDYASLFGSVELCDCEHCRSIYSPAAYLVDLLQFLGPKIPGAGVTTPLDVLIGNPGKNITGRRPDIAHILLSCENTNTTLPYVDLVNEVLESTIAFQQTLPLKTDAAGERLVPNVARPNESSAGVTAAELAANPENTSDAAYEALETAVYPFSLPFNQPITALRLTLEQMGSSRHEVMTVFGKKNDEAAGCARDVEALKVSEREFAILTGEEFDGTPVTRPVSDFYGFEMPVPPADTAWVKGATPPGAQEHLVGDTWAFAAFAPPPDSGAVAHTSTVAPGLHQHYFENAPDGSRLKVGNEDFLFAEIFLDPANLPREIMLQWNDGTWEHRAYWGPSKSLIGVGVEGTASLRYMGPLPAAGEWLRLEVPAYLVDLGGRELSGMAFTLFNGGATWGAAGKRSRSWVEWLTQVPNLLSRTGVTYVELIELLRTQYVNRALPQGKALAAFERIPVSYDVLATLVASNFADLSPSTLEALNGAEMTKEDLEAWAAEYFVPVGKMIVLDAPDSACDLTVTRLQHLDGTLLDDDELSRLHRFIRLWRKLGWAAQDVDRALIALQAPDITPPFLRQLGQIVLLQAALDLPTQKLLSFWGNIPTTGNDALYQTLFLNKAVREIDAVFAPIEGEYLPAAADLKISDHVPALLAALRTRAADLALIRDKAKLSTDNARLTLETATTLYRYVTLARALKLAVQDLIDIETLSGDRLFAGPLETLSFVRRARSVMQSGFKPAILRYLFNEVKKAPPGLTPSAESIQTVLSTLREGLVHIASENIPGGDPAGELTRAKLGLLFEAHVVEHIAGMIARPQIFTVPLAALPPDVSLPAGKITYDAPNRLLKAAGWMTDAELGTLLPLSNAEEYKKAIQALYNQPRSVIEQTLVKRLGWVPAVSVMEAMLLSVEEITGLATQSNSAPLAALPRGLRLPEGKVSYDKNARMLKAAGWLTATEQDVLLALSGADGYQTAVKSLYTQQHERVILFLKSLGWTPEGAVLKAISLDPEELLGLVAGNQVYTAPLASRPIGLVLPMSKVSHDQNSHLLKVTGWLTAAEHAALLALPDADDALVNAVASIYQRPRHLIRQFLLKLLGWTTEDVVLNALSLGAEGELESAMVAGKFRVILTGILPPLSKALGRAFVKQTLADALALEPATAALLLEGADGVVPLKTDDRDASPAIVDFLALSGNGLRATYFANKNLAEPAHESRVDPTIDFRWADKHGFSVRWEGALLAEKTQHYQFHLRAGGGILLTIDGKKLIDEWQDAARAEYTAAVDLEAGKPYTIMLEYFNDKAAAQVELRWSGPAAPAEIVPSYRLYSASPADVFAAAAHTYIRLHKASLLVNGFKLTPHEIAFLADPGDDNKALHLNELPVATAPKEPHALFTAWMRWRDFVELRGLATSDPSSLPDVFTASVGADARQALVRATGWDAKALDAVAGDHGLKLTVPAYKNTETLLQLFDAMRLLDVLGAPATEVFGWAKPLSSSTRSADDGITNTDTSLSSATASFTAEDEGRTVTGAGIPDDTTIKSVLDETNVELSQPTTATATGVQIGIHEGNRHARAAAQEAKRAHKARYDNEAWLEIARPIADRLRESQRAALVTYLLPRLGYTDPNQLFEHFLIDVEMDPCMQTSRIKQAISSVQLFVQRCRMNLEPDVSPKMIPADRWEWMQNYRVWEANLKVFLYPENWIEPELRDDKSPFFRELESELLQAEVTDDTAEIALGNYLEKLDTVSQLQICGMVEQIGFDPEERRQSVLHVFGHTFATPRIFYYRQLVTVNPSYRYWTAWEKVPLDIQADEVLPVIWNRRLYLFWQVTTEKVNKEGWDPTMQTKTSTLRLAWSIYRQGKWSAKLVTAANQALATPISTLLAKQYPPIGENPTIAMAAEISGAELTIVIATPSTWRDARPTSLWLGNVTFRNHNGLVEPTKLALMDVTHDRGFLPIGETTLEFLPANRDAAVPVFGRIPHTGGMRFFSQGFLPYTLNDLFFIQEGPRAYLVLPYNFWSSKVEYIGAKVIQAYLPATNAADPITSSKESNVALLTSFTQLSTKSNAWLSGPVGIAAMEIQALSEPALAEPALAGQLQEVSSFSVSTENFLYNVAKIGALMVPRYPAEFRFETFFHPYTPEFQQRLNRYGVPGLLNIDSQRPTSLPKVTSFADAYVPDESTVKKEWPKHDVDFEISGAYSLYNWEIFFHVPLFLATRLSQNQRFEEAMRWFHYIFDPTAGSPADPIPQRYWNVLPFRETQPQRLDDMLKALHAGEKNVIAQWEDLQANPFKPHRVARLRTLAYQKTVVMKYIDNLIAWGDQLFRQDTIETLNQATQLYVLAALLLGPRVQRLPQRGRNTPKTYAQLRDGLQKFNLVMDSFENDLPFSSRTTGGESSTETTGLLGIGRTFYFCIPKNEKLLGYWDTVADRLFKIRHCMNIEGVVRELPLFEPPIDPALLVKAAAQGIDLSSVLSDLSAPLPYYRFSTLLGKALEMTAELRSLGAALLAALEKRDVEHLANLRASHETELLSLVKQVKQQQLTEAQTAETALQKSREVTQTRFDFYSSIQQRITEETNQLQKLEAAQKSQSEGQQAEGTASDITVNSTDISVGAQLGGTAAGPSISGTTGRGNIIAYYQAVSREKSFQASIHTYHANLSSILGGWKRRTDEWNLQKNLALKELAQIDKQITAAGIRVAIARQELDNTTRQIEQSQEIQEYLRNKFTGEELYNWMVGEISTIFFQCYQMTYDLAKKAERSCRFELGLATSNFIQFGTWDSMRKGLLSGERLYLQLKQMERAYLDGNRREYELTKHYSLVQNDPLALIGLKERGWCEIELPEALFDIDFPGHYMRRVKSVSLSIPAVVGPFTGVNCTLTLLRDKTRVKSTSADGYAERDGEEDNRFLTSWTRMQAIATSSGQNDSGLFELNFRDERYLPFEGGGVVSRWRIELPRDFRQFDYDTISDVVLHIKYTAREGGVTLRDAAVASLKQQLHDEASKPQARLFSLRHEFPSEWHRLQNVADINGDHNQAFSLAKHLFPFVFQGGTITVTKIDLFGIPLSREKTPTAELTLTLTDPNGGEVELREAAPVGLLVHTSAADQAIEVKNLDETKKEADWTFKVSEAAVLNSLKQMEDILVLCHYSVDVPKNL